jgi:hypothetical protein
MKKGIILIGIVSAVFATDLIPFEMVENVAQRFTSQRIGFSYLDEVLTYYGVDEQPNAYALVYRDASGEPFTIVIGARYTCTPILEFSRTLPNYYKNLEKARTKAMESCAQIPSFEKIYYFAPQEEYYSFKSQDQEILINTYSLSVHDKKFFQEVEKKRDNELENALKGKWQGYLSGTDFTTRAIGYVDSVPFVIWSYGCSPTASSMPLWYWDSRGYGRLVDNFFDRWDNVETEWDYNLPNCIRELAIGMYTDSMSTGGTSVSLIDDGHIYACNTVNGYSFTSQASPSGHSGNNYVFDWLETEIDAQRPCNWSILHYQGSTGFNHSTCAVGYEFVSFNRDESDTFVILHNTWDTNEHWWPLWTYISGIQSYDYVYTVVPGGANSNNIFLDFPQGSGFLIEGMKYYIKWESVGSDIDHVKLWYSEGIRRSNDSIYWTLIDGNTLNDGEYLWTIPEEDSAIRINISGMNPGSERLAADGSIYKRSCVYPEHTSNLDLCGHFDNAFNSYDVVIIDDYAYIANGMNGLVVVDVSDSSLPTEAAHLPLPGKSIALSVVGSNLYLLDEEDTLRVISISTPTSPTQTGKCALGVDLPQDLFTVDDLVYVAGRGSGIFIFDVSNPTPSLVGSYNTPGQAYSVLVSDTLAYVADGIKGLRVLNVADLGDITEIGFYDTNGVTQGLALKGTTIYLAEGSQGIKIFNVSDPTDPQPLSSLALSGPAASFLLSDSLFVACGEAGIRILDVSNSSDPIEVEYLDSFDSAVNIAKSGDMLYLADRADGLYLIHEDILPGVEETVEEFLSRPKLSFSSPQIGNLAFSLTLNNTSTVAINIYDVSGRLFKSIQSENMTAGEYKFNFSPDAAGVYFIRLKTNECTMTNKVVFVR